MKLTKIKNDFPNMLLAFLSSLWIAPFAFSILIFLSTESSGLELNSNTFEFILNSTVFIGLLWFFTVWLIWSFILIKRFRNGHIFHLKDKEKMWKTRFLSLLSVGWIFFFWGFFYLYCFAKMRDQSIEYISSGAHIFYMIKNLLTLAFLFLAIVLQRLFISLLKRLEN